MYDIILSFLTAFTLTYFAIPSIINIAKKKNLTDEPDERRSHTESTPSLGGIAIFAGVIFSIILWTPFGLFGDLQYILCSFIIIFFYIMTSLVATRGIECFLEISIRALLAIP